MNLTEDPRIRVADRLNKILPAAELIGNSQLLRIIHNLADSNAPIPMSESEARRYREVGDKAIEELTQLGIVISDYSDPVEFVGLNKRTANVLKRARLTNRELVVAAIKSGELMQHSGDGYGWSMHKAVCEWAGLPKPVRTKRVPVCPHCSKRIMSRLEYQTIECHEPTKRPPHQQLRPALPRRHRQTQAGQPRHKRSV